MLEMMVGQMRRRNKNITITTSPMVTSRVNCTSLTEARMVVVRSAMTLSSMPGGIQCRSCGSIFLMSSTI